MFCYHHMSEREEKHQERHNNIISYRELRRQRKNIYFINQVYMNELSTRRRTELDGEKNI